MYKYKKHAWLVPFMLFLINTICHYAIIYNICPGATKVTDLTLSPEQRNPPELREPGTLVCNEKYFYYIYEKTYTRMSPYGFGMFAAFIHVLDQDK